MKAQPNLRDMLDRLVTTLDKGGDLSAAIDLAHQLVHVASAVPVAMTDLPASKAFGALTARALLTGYVSLEAEVSDDEEANP